jgi:hypothetical protein
MPLKSIFQFAVKEYKIKNIKVLPQAIGEFNIYESITNPAILGHMTLADWQGFDEVGEIFAGDPFEIVFCTEDETELSLKFTIFSNSIRVNPASTFNVVTYNFCSPWLVDGLIRQVSKHYKDKYIHEIIADLLKEVGAEVGYIEPTKQKLNHFTTPLWTVVHSITHLCSFAMNKQDVGGYNFWTDLKDGKVYCTTMDYLYKGTHGVDDQAYTTIARNEFYQNRVETISIENTFDLIRYANLGMGNTRFDGVFYDKKKVFSTKEDVTQIPHAHLSTKLPLNIKYKDKKYASIKACYIHPSTDSLISDDKIYEEHIMGKLKNRYANLFVDAIKANVFANPNSSRRAGMMCLLKYQTQSQPKTGTDKQYTGYYIIRDIRHIMFNGVYKQAVSMICDGYKLSNNNLITWGSK